MAESLEGPYFEDGLCAICGKPTIRSGWGAVEEQAGVDRSRKPFVCSKCLVDLRGDMATELEVRRQMGNLEKRLQVLETKLWYQSLVLNVMLAIAGFLAGALVGVLAP